MGYCTNYRVGEKDTYQHGSGMSHQRLTSERNHDRYFKLKFQRLIRSGEAKGREEFRKSGNIRIEGSYR